MRPIRIRRRIMRNCVQIFHTDAEGVGFTGSGVGPGGLTPLMISEPSGARVLSARPIRLFGTSQMEQKLLKNGSPMRIDGVVGVPIEAISRTHWCKFLSYCKRLLIGIENVMFLSSLSVSFSGRFTEVQSPGIQQSPQLSSESLHQKLG